MKKDNKKDIITLKKCGKKIKQMFEKTIDKFQI